MFFLRKSGVLVLPEKGSRVLIKMLILFLMNLSCCVTCVSITGMLMARTMCSALNYGPDTLNGPIHGGGLVI
jgi:hypothetical protein